MDNDRMVVSLKSSPKREEPVTAPLMKKSLPKKSKVKNVLALLLFLGVAGVGAYVFIDFSSLSAYMPDSLTKANGSSGEVPDDVVADVAALSEEVSDVIAAVGRHILLPDGEEPTVATVSDPSKLKDQLFFKHAKAGDRVLIYTKAKMAYLYDPKRDILLEVAPITTDTP